MKSERCQSRYNNSNKRKIDIIQDSVDILFTKTYIFQFQANHHDKELADLAKIIFAVSSAQLTVETAFSVLKFILSNKKYNLEDTFLIQRHFACDF